MDDPTTQYFNEILADSLNEQNRRLFGCGWINREMPWSTKYVKAVSLDNVLVELMVGIQKRTEYADVPEGRVNSYAICFGVENIHLLGGGNTYFAEAHESTGNPFECIERPMSEEELSRLYSTFKSELADFEQVRLGCLGIFLGGKRITSPERARMKPAIMEDLDGFYAKAREGLKEDWERYSITNLSS